MQRRKNGVCRESGAGDADEASSSSCYSGSDSDTGVESDDGKFKNTGVFARKADLEGGFGAIEGGFQDQSKSRRSSSVNFKVVALLIIAMFILYLGFWGGENLAQALSLDSAEMEDDAQSAAFSSQLEDDDDDDDAAEEGLDYPQILHAYYKKHNPKLLGDAPMILARYSGNEKELFAKLQKKYGDPVLPREPKLGKSFNNDDEEEEGEGGEDLQPEDEEEDRISAISEGHRGGSQDALGSGLVDASKHTSKSRYRSNPHVVDFETEIDEDGDSDDVPNARKQKSNDQQEFEESEEGEEEEIEDGFPVNDQSETNDDENSDNDLSPDAAFDVHHEIDDGMSIFEDMREESIVGRGKVKVIGIGFPGTGIDQVHRFIQDALKWDAVPRDDVSSALREIMSKPGLPSFDKFDQYDALVDDTTSLFFEELLATYPKAKVILTVRPVDEWFEAFKMVLNKFSGDLSLMLRREIYEVLLGNLTVNEFIWKKQYQLFYDRALRAIPRSRRKLICVYAEEENRWEWLGRFLTDTQQQTGSPFQFASTWRAPRLPPSRALTMQLRSKTVVDPLSKLHFLSNSVVASPVDYGTLRVIGAGLDGTGGAVLAQALKKLGYKVASHWTDTANACTECRKVAQNLQGVLSGTNQGPVNFGYNGIFHGVDAIVGSPASMLVQEAARFNPDAKVVVTVRNLDLWWQDMRCRVRAMSKHQSKYSKSTKSKSGLASYYHKLVFGSEDPAYDFLHKRRYRDHLLNIEGISPDRILVIDLSRAGPSGDAWRQLCRFLRSNKCTPRLETSSFPTIKSFCVTKSTGGR